MTVCPICKSTHVTTRQVGRDTGRNLGGVAGAASTWSGSQVGASFGAVGGPVGIALGATAGSVAGSLLRDVVDKHYLGNCECLDIGGMSNNHSWPCPISCLINTLRGVVARKASITNFLPPDEKYVTL